LAGGGGFFSFLQKKTFIPPKKVSRDPGGGGGGGVQFYVTSELSGREIQTSYGLRVKSELSYAGNLGL